VLLRDAATPALGAQVFLRPRQDAIHLFDEASGRSLGRVRVDTDASPAGRGP
jgi:hypothetical protein